MLEKRRERQPEVRQQHKKPRLELHVREHCFQGVVDRWTSRDGDALEFQRPRHAGLRRERVILAVVLRQQLGRCARLVLCAVAAREALPTLLRAGRGRRAKRRLRVAVGGLVAVPWLRGL
jgi:hypothetical protein